MEYIKNTQKLQEFTEKLVCDYGYPEDIASHVDELIFEYMRLFLDSQECGHRDIFTMVDTLRGLRDFCKDLEQLKN